MSAEARIEATAANAPSNTQHRSELMHPNEQLVRSSYDAFCRRDLPSLLDLLSDKITFKIPGTSIQAGTFAGKHDIARYFSIVNEHTAGTHRVEVIDVLANDLRAVSLVRALGEHGSDTFDMTVLHLWRLSNGKATEVSIIPVDQYTFDRFWS
jgi:ketosteroid isomerase-like protein